MNSTHAWRTLCHFACWHINSTSHPLHCPLSLGSKRITAGGARYHRAAISRPQTYCIRPLAFIFSRGKHSAADLMGSCDTNSDSPAGEAHGLIPRILQGATRDGAASKMLRSSILVEWKVCVVMIEFDGGNHSTLKGTLNPKARRILQCLWRINHRS